MEKTYNSSMYQSLSDYVCNNAKEITYPGAIDYYAEFCKTEKNHTFEYAFDSVLAMEHVSETETEIEDLMMEWFETNGIDFKNFKTETTCHGEWMVRTIPDTFTFLRHHLLMDLACHQNVLESKVE